MPTPQSNGGSLRLAGLAELVKHRNEMRKGRKNYRETHTHVKPYEIRTCKPTENRMSGPVTYDSYVMPDKSDAYKNM
jgi:hypothetical protein